MREIMIRINVFGALCREHEKIAFAPIYELAARCDSWVRKYANEKEEENRPASAVMRYSDLRTSRGCCPVLEQTHIRGVEVVEQPSRKTVPRVQFMFRSSVHARVPILVFCVRNLQRCIPSDLTHHLFVRFSNRRKLHCLCEPKSDSYNSLRTPYS